MQKINTFSDVLSIVNPFDLLDLLIELIESHGENREVFIVKFFKFFALCLNNLHIREFFGKTFILQVLDCEKLYFFVFNRVQ